MIYLQGLPNSPGAGALPPPLPQAPTNIPFGAPFSYNIPPNDQCQENASKPLNVNLDKVLINCLLAILKTIIYFSQTFRILHLLLIQVFHRI